MRGSQESPGLRLCHLSHLYEQALSAELASLGITAQYLRVLLVIEVDEGLSQTELAARLQMDDAPLASLLKRMERDGWIYRKDSPTDRRKKLVLPMPAADRARERMHAAVQRIDWQAFASLEPAAAERFLEVLSAMQANILRLRGE